MDYELRAQIAGTLVGCAITFICSVAAVTRWVDDDRLGGLVHVLIGAPFAMCGFVGVSMAVGLLSDTPVHVTAWQWALAAVPVAIVVVALIEGGLFAIRTKIKPAGRAVGSG